MPEEKDYTELDALIAEVKAEGIDPDAAAEWVDGLIDWNTKLPQPLGAVAEALDGAVIRSAGKALKKLGDKLVTILTDPEARKKRKARRKARKDKRAKKRSEASE